MSEPGLRAELGDGARRWLSDTYGEDRRRRTLAGDGFDAAAWSAMAELGWFGVMAGEAEGGLGLGLGDLAVLAEAVGAANIPEPVSAVAGVAVPLLAACGGNHAGAAALLAGVIDGSRIAALAHAEPESGFDRDVVGAICEAEGRGLRLVGRKVAVTGGAVADAFLVTARGETGPVLTLVPRDTPGVTVTEYRAIDGRRLADLDLAATLPPEAILPLADPAASIDDAIDRGALLAMAEAVGAMQTAFDDTLAHLKTRRQFGKTLGSFQALQHRVVDMMIAVEEARALVEVAADEDDPAERRRAIAAAKVVGIRSARRVGREAVQLHGGIGITEDLRVSHLFRRLVALEHLHGDRDTYLDRYRSLRANRG